MGKPAFIEQFNTEYGADRWLSVQDDIRGIVRDLFNALSSYILTETIDTYCAALYGIDIMMDDKLRPHVIEVNYGPDCRTVCKQHPGFFPDVFKCMFTSRPLSETIVELK
jgi:tubulin--tyrosine ligase-like protein 12